MSYSEFFIKINTWLFYQEHNWNDTQEIPFLLHKVEFLYIHPFPP